jgi:hypothetical protein
MVLRSFISWDNKELEKKDDDDDDDVDVSVCVCARARDTRNLATVAAGLMISKPLCSQICRSCDSIPFDMKNAQTWRTAGGHVS